MEWSEPARKNRLFFCEYSKGDQFHQHGPEEGPPLRASQPLMRIPVTNKLWIQPQAGVIDEGAAVKLADIHLSNMTLDNRGNGFIQIKWETEILGKMVHQVGAHPEQRLCRPTPRQRC